MRLILISLFALVMSLILVISGNAYLLTLIGVHLGSTGIEPAQVGYVMTAYSVGFVLGAILTPSLLIKVGHIRAFAALASLASMAAIIYPLTDSLIVWGLLRFIGGLAVAGLFIAIESWFSAVASDTNRATLFSLYQVAAYSASAGGQIMLNVGMESGHSAAFTLGGLLLIAAIIPLSISRLQSPPMENAKLMSPILLWRRAPLGVYGAFSGGMLIGGFYALIPLYGTLTELNTREIGQIMSISVIVAMVVAWPLGWLCDRITRSWVLFAISVIGASAAVFAYLYSASSLWILIVSSSILMAIAASIYSVSVAITNDLVVSEERVGASSTLMMSYGLGSILGPLGGSWIMQSFNPTALFSGFLLIFTLLAVFTRYRQMKMPPISIADQEHYVPAMPESQVSVEFDPRTDDLPDTPIEQLFPDYTAPDEQNPDETKEDSNEHWDEQEFRETDKSKPEASP